jgi:conjugal transfer/entry exclusion protein
MSNDIEELLAISRWLKIQQDLNKIQRRIDRANTAKQEVLKIHDPGKYTHDNIVHRLSMAKAKAKAEGDTNLLQYVKSTMAMARRAFRDN